MRNFKKVISLVMITMMALLMFTGCGSKTVTMKDMEGTEFTVPKKIERIVSTAPSNTEILVGLGLGDKIVGVDKYSSDVKGLNSEVKSITATTIKLISFTINDTEYKAIEGMTWGEWVDSKYNVEDAYGISGAGYVVFKVASGGFYYFDSFNKKDELIIENGKYTHNTSGMPEIE